jgi:hypothetical protein
MVRIALTRLTLFAPLAVAGCSGISADWIKPGASEAQVKADNAVCRAEAEDVFGQSANITHDINVSLPRDPSQTSDRVKELRTYEAEEDYDKVFGACMAARGYSRGRSDR